MIGLNRSAMLAATLAVAGASTAVAQIPGMPLFTNPRYGTGIRVHADIGQPTEEGTTVGDLTVVQGGLSFALGPVGIGANIGMSRADLQANAGCNPTSGSSCDPETKLTGSALAQIRIAGGGRSNLSMSLFGGASTDLTAYDVANINCSGGFQSFCDQLQTKELTIPVGVAIGLRIPLGVASLNLWGAPRYNLTKYVNCGTSNQVVCDETEGNFRWAVGADFPIFRVISVRAAYDSGKINDVTYSFWGVGASIGIGGMR